MKKENRFNSIAITIDILVWIFTFYVESLTFFLFSLIMPEGPFGCTNSPFSTHFLIALLNR